MTPVELRSLAEVTAWLASGLAVRRVPAPSGPSSLEQDVTAALLACASELPTLPPPGVIADLVMLLAGARAARGATAPAAVPDRGLRAALRAYDDDVLARLLAIPCFDDLVAAHAHLPPALRGAAIALVASGIVERAGFTGVAVSPGVLRRALARDRGAPDVAEGIAAASAALADAYLRLARGARQSRALVVERDVFTIEHLESLGTASHRLAALQIAAAADALVIALPRRLPTRRALRGSAPSTLAAEDSYPAGGFAGIVAGGESAALENLVTSELAFMEPEGGAGDTDIGRGDGVDLFTLRYVESELLFYTRDDSVLLRPRHAIAIVLAPELAEARVKDPRLPWQRIVLALATAIAAIRWLGDRFGERALAIRLAFPPQVLAAERELVSLVLAAEIEAGLVAVDEVTVAVALERTAAAPASWRDAVVIGGPSGGPSGDLGSPASSHSPAGVPTPPGALRLRHVPLPAPAPGTAGAAAWEAWTELLEDLLRWLV